MSKYPLVRIENKKFGIKRSSEQFAIQIKVKLGRAKTLTGFIRSDNKHRKMQHSPCIRRKMELQWMYHSNVLRLSLQVLNFIYGTKYKSNTSSVKHNALRWRKNMKNREKRKVSDWFETMIATLKFIFGGKWKCWRNIFTGEQRSNPRDMETTTATQFKFVKIVEFTYSEALAHFVSLASIYKWVAMVAVVAVAYALPANRATIIVHSV